MRFTTYNYKQSAFLVHFLLGFDIMFPVKENIRMKKRKIDLSRAVVVLVDVQNDFITGKLGSEAAQAVLPKIVAFAKRAAEANADIYATQDTHGATVRDIAGDPQRGYLASLEGKKLPVEHCIALSEGWQLPRELVDAVKNAGSTFETVSKPTFGSFELDERIRDWSNLDTYDEKFEKLNPEAKKIVICGFCTDICVVSNALILRSAFPDTEICIVEDLCAGTTPEKHAAALAVMQSCQIDVVETTDFTC